MEKSNRIFSLDLLRVMACLLVVWQHTSEFYYIPSSFRVEANDNTFWVGVMTSIARTSVPLFVMITGYFLLPVSGAVSAFFRKRFTRILYPFIAWCIIYAAYYVFYQGDSLQQMWTNLLHIPVNFGTQVGHLWYIYMLIGLYLYMPVFSAWIERADKRQKEFFLGLWFLSTFLPYLLEFAGPYAFGTCSWNTFGLFYYFAGFNGYLLLGHYIRFHLDWSFRKTLPAAVVMLVAGFTITYLGYGYIMSLPEKTPEQIELFWTYNTPNVALMSMDWFLLLKHVRVSAESRAGKMLDNLAFCGFGIYMIHYFFVGLAYGVITGLSLPTPLLIPAAAVLIFVLSWSIVYIVKRYTGKAARYVMG